MSAGSGHGVSTPKSGLSSTFATRTADLGGDFTSGGAALGQAPLADGAGGVAWGTTGGASAFAASVQLFDVETTVLDQYIVYSTGLTGASDTNARSDYIPVTAGLQYCLTNNAATRLAWYNASQVYISGSNAVSNPLTAPANAAYLRFSQNDTQIPMSSVMLAQAATLPAWVEYGTTLPAKVGVNLLREGEVYTKAEVDAKVPDLNLFVDYNHSAGRFYVVTPGNNDGDAYRHTLLKVTIPYTTGSTYQNADLWRLTALYAGTWTGTAFTAGSVMCNDSAWETAIKVNLAADFVGTYHGYEVLNSATFFVDGVPTAFTADATAECREFRMVYGATIYKQGTAADDIATIVRDYVWTRDGLTLHQKVRWTEALLIDDAYMTMLPILRDNVSNRAATDYDGNVYDISTTGHATAISTQVEDVNRLVAWHTTNGYTFEVEVDYGTTGLINEFNVNNSAAYNKCYWSLAAGVTTAPGDLWTIRSHYRFRRN